MVLRRQAASALASHRDPASAASARGQRNWSSACSWPTDYLVNAVAKAVADANETNRNMSQINPITQSQYRLLYPLRFATEAEELDEERDEGRRRCPQSRAAAWRRGKALPLSAVGSTPGATRPVRKPARRRPPRGPRSSLMGVIRVPGRGTAPDRGGGGSLLAILGPNWYLPSLSPAQRGGHS